MRTKATFRLGGDAMLTAARATERLGVTPTWSAEVGSRSRPASRPRADALWLLSSAPEAEPGVELADQLLRLLAILEPVADALWELVGEGYAANWFCYVGSHSTEHAVELDRSLLARLLALPGDLWLDVHCDEPDRAAG